MNMRKHFSTARTSDERTMIQRRVEDLDDQIYLVVYDLYDLSIEEQNAVEESMNRV
jgi:hypothetical protein